MKLFLFLKLFCLILIQQGKMIECNFHMLLIQDQKNDIYKFSIFNECNIKCNNNRIYSKDTQSYCHLKYIFKTLFSYLENETLKRNIELILVDKLNEIEYHASQLVKEKLSKCLNKRESNERILNPFRWG